MAVVRIPDEDRVLTAPEEVDAHLKSINIGYEFWKASQPVATAVDDVTHGTRAGTLVCGVLETHDRRYHATGAGLRAFVASRAAGRVQG